TTIGNHVVIGTNTVIDGNVTIADFVKIESNCYICTHVTIGSRVFFGPNVTLLNDKYPLKMRDDYNPVGPIIEDDVTLGGGVVVLPGVRVGEGSFVAAGAVVTKDVPPRSFVKGVPGKVSPLPAKLQERNMALSWRKYLK
ncbi:MAG: N-acetyltransferase, partial [Nitrospinae bacterium]|nr:N-acetyltransferase [Nitrospinota bacterium]